MDWLFSIKDIKDKGLLESIDRIVEKATTKEPVATALTSIYLTLSSYSQNFDFLLTEPISH